MCNKLAKHGENTNSYDGETACDETSLFLETREVIMAPDNAPILLVTAISGIILMRVWRLFGI